MNTIALPAAQKSAQKSAQLANARRILQPYEGIVDWYVMPSTDAAPKMPDNYFDYIHVDARRDYCAVTEDLERYWPTLRPGGIMAGHDFVTATEANAIVGPLEDWSKCENGTVHDRAVQRAVEDFAKARNLEITLTQEGFDTWLIHKPYDE
jgi:predicted O-methyltransferase YrrM